jgi:proteasome accessory factor B
LDAVDGYVEISKDDEQARRIASLALAFMSSDIIRDDTIWHAFYSDLTKADSYRTAFRRDRAALAECGITVRRVNSPEALWQVDSASFVESTELSKEDAMALDVACLPLVDDQDFPYGAELRIALSKIDDAFDYPVSVALPAEERVPSRQLATLQECSFSGIAASIDYTRADGTTIKRRIAPYGFFGMRGHLYMVAPAIDDAGFVIAGSSRTYRIDRVHRASKIAGTSFEIPEDFDIRDWQKLPFQLGPTSCEGVFAVPEDAVREFMQVTRGKGTFETPTATHEPHATTTWRVEVSNIEDAASWAIAEDITPLSPAELVAAWYAKLEGVVAHG